MLSRVVIALALAAAGGGAEDAPGGAAETPVLRWTGTPVRLPFECTSDDLQMFEMPCTAEAPCPVYLQLTSAKGVEEKIFVAGNLHNRAATILSVLLKSEDGGQTWTEAHPRMRGAGLDMIHFHDAKTGWVAGHVLTLPPRDPFFLLTTDGGKYWRKREVFNETRIGVIEEFWFDDARSGGVLVDRVRASETGARYERYETMTGGADWSIREVSATPIQVKNVRPAGPDPDWRVSEDAATQSWLIQRRRAGEWSTVTSFQVEVGACGPPPVEEPVEPPPEPEEQAPAAPKELPTAPGGVFRLPGPGGQQPPADKPRTPAAEKPPGLN